MIFCAAVTGPTAGGKTSLSLQLAEAFSGEILCLDSMQIYRGMDIGTAKPTPAERSRAVHHLCDFLSPTESFSVSDYRALALPLAKSLSESGKLPIFVGGTGLYLSSLLRDPAERTPGENPAYRASLEARAASEEGKAALFERLKEVDPESAAAVHPNNVRRVIRALEIFDATGTPKSVWDRESKKIRSPLALCHITLDYHSRETLYQRIDERIRLMLRDGLEEEVRLLYDRNLLSPDSTAGQAIGYKEFSEYFRGLISKDEAVERIRMGSRHYAKRQQTWFRAQPEAHTLFMDGEDGRMRSGNDVLREACDILSEAEKTFEITGNYSYEKERDSAIQ